MSADQVEAHWEDFAQHLERFARLTGEFTPEQIRDNCKASKMQMWGLQDETAVQGICVTEVIQTARGLICLVALACGSCPRDGYAKILDAISDWARELGCVAMRIQGRKGWLRDPRWKQTGIVAECEL